jgi:hypothetical protein
VLCRVAPQVLSPGTILAVDLAALTLLDLPCLVAVILGVLADEFGWVAKSFPQAFSVSVWRLWTSAAAAALHLVVSTGYCIWRMPSNPA